MTQLPLLLLTLATAGEPLPEAAVARLGSTRLTHARGVFGLAFVDSKTLVSCGGDHKIAFWAMPTGRRLPGKLPADAEARQLAVSADGSTLAVLRGESRLAVFATATGRPVLQLDIGDEAGGVALSPDGKLLAAFGSSVTVWDVATGKLVRRSKGKEFRIEWLAFSPDSKTLALAGHSAGVWLWDFGAAKAPRELEDAPANVTGVAFADNKSVIVGSLRGVHIVDAATGKVVRRFAGGPDLYSLALSADGKTLAVPQEGGTLLLFDPATGKEKGRCSLADVEAGQPVIYYLALSPDGRLLAAAAANDSRIFLFDTATGKPLHRHPGHGHQVTWVAASPDGKQAATVAADRTLRLWDLAIFKEVRRLGAGDAALSCAAFSPDGTKVAACAVAGEDRSWVQLWDAATGKPLRTLGKPGKALRVLAFSPDGKWLAAVGSGESVRIWQPDTGTELPPLRLKKPVFATGLVFAAGGERLISAHFDHALRFWDVDDGKAVRNRTDHRGSVLALAVGGEGTVLASGAADGLAILYDPTKAVVLAKCDTGQSHVFAVAVSPDGRWLVTTGIDCKLAVWEVATGRRLADFAGHVAWVHSLAFTPDGTRLLSASDDTTVLVWDVRKLLGRTPLPARQLGDEELKTLWRDLGGAEPRPANEAVRVLAAAPAQAVALLRARLKPPAAVKLIPELIAQLDDKTFAVREKATAALRELGPLAEEALRNTLEDRPTAEVQARVEKLLAALSEPDADSPRHGARAVRIVAVLEEIGNAEARALLEELAKDAAGTRLSREARAALKRLR
jgi:WD40 repeat protein